MKGFNQLKDHHRSRILRELDRVPGSLMKPGKISLTLIFNCGTNGTVQTIKVQKSIEDEER